MLISLIDDDPLYHFIIKKQLYNSGIPGTLLQFYDGQEALEYFISNQGNAENLPDLILLDINMPYIDGWQFLDEIAKLYLAKKDMKIYIVSSSNSSTDQQKATAYNYLSGYLRKPLSTEDFLNLVTAE